MKVIDLLNKIANGEIEENIKYNFLDYEYCTIKEFFNRYVVDKWNLNLEILEEKKIPKKIKDKYCSQISKVELAQKYNEIIDYLDYLKSKGE